MKSMSDIVVVMVHVWDDDPEVPQVRWKEFGRKCALAANLLPWPKIWQFDFIDKDYYNKFYAANADELMLSTLKTSNQGRVPHRNVLVNSVDYVTTSNQQTKMILDQLNPRIALFGGLHKDLCVRGVMLDIKDQQREYLESDLLSYTWIETLKKAEEYDPSFKK